MDIAKQRIRQKDQNGALVAAGFTWFEPRFGILKRRGWVKVLLFVFGWMPLFTLFAHLNGARPFLSPFFLYLPLLTLAGIIYMMRGRGFDHLNQKRGLIFRTDGTTLYAPDTPAGDNAVKFEVAHNVDHAGIVSIEGRPTPAINGGHARVGEWAIYQVDLHFEDGSSLYTAKDLTDPDAMRVIVVQLNQALRDVRMAAGAAVTVSGG